MNNEETILDPQFGKKSEKVNNPQPKKTSTGDKAAYGVGGAVFGATATFAGQAAANNRTDEVPVEMENQIEEPTSVETAAPAPEDSIVATTTGVRVAHVDDNASFSDAFKDARAQVGAGGVFEWRGRVYGTYYKDEWENMSSEERSEYQASIDYDEVVSNENIVQHQGHSDLAQNTNVHQDGNVQETSYADNVQDQGEVYVETAETQQSPEELEVHVLEVGQTDLNGDGIPENAAILDINGNEVLIVDIDQDGVAEAMIADVNGNGSIEDNELIDISSENLSMPDMSSGDMYMAQADANPDYMNDASIDSYV